MNQKWSWLADRIKQSGYATITSFANAIDWPSSRLSEMINGTTVNGGKTRNIPKNKIAIVAKLLNIPMLDLIAYNNDISHMPPLTENVNNDKSDIATQQPQKKKLTTSEEEELIKIVLETVDEFLDENGLEMSIDGKAKIFAHLLRAACKEPTIIKGILSGMLLGNSSLFSKKSR